MHTSRRETQWNQSRRLNWERKKQRRKTILTMRYQYCGWLSCLKRQNAHESSCELTKENRVRSTERNKNRSGFLWVNVCVCVSIESFQPNLPRLISNYLFLLRLLIPSWNNTFHEFDRGKTKGSAHEYCVHRRTTISYRYTIEIYSEFCQRVVDAGWQCVKWIA